MKHAPAAVTAARQEVACLRVRLGMEEGRRAAALECISTIKFFLNDAEAQVAWSPAERLQLIKNALVHYRVDDAAVIEYFTTNYPSVINHCTDQPPKAQS